MAGKPKEAAAAAADAAGVKRVDDAAAAAAAVAASDCGDCEMFMKGGMLFCPMFAAVMG